MNGWRVVAVAQLGIIVGLTVTLIVRSSGNDAGDRAAKEFERRIDAANAQIQQMAAELAAARDARRRPRDGIERPPGEVPPDSRSVDPEPAKTPSKAAAGQATTEPPELLVAKARSQLRTARIDLQTAMAAHDGDKALDLLKQIAKIAHDLPEARDDAMKLAVDIFKDVNGSGELHLSQFVFYGGLGDPAVRDLMLWSMDNQGASPAEFRVLSAWSIPWAMKPDEAIARYDATLARETDRNVQTAIVSNLSSMNTPKAEAVLVRIFGDVARDPALRGDAAMALATSKDPAVQRAIETAAQSDPEPRVQSAARLSLIVRDPPATGILVTQTTAEGNAETAGIRSGDVIVSYNGRAVPTGEDLRREIGAASGVENIPVLIVRDGREQSIQVKPGRLGLPALQPVQKR